jgi:hypothetical protein
MSHANLLHQMTTICHTISDAFAGSMHHTPFPLNSRLHYPRDWRLPGTKHWHRGGGLLLLVNASFHFIFSFTVVVVYRLKADGNLRTTGTFFEPRLLLGLTDGCT